MKKFGRSVLKEMITYGEPVLEVELKGEQGVLYAVGISS
jgi:hypothetical protein